jgi:cytochrome P450
MTASYDRVAERIVAPRQNGLPPGPPVLPLVGTPINLLRFFADPIAFMRRLQRRYGNVATLARGRSDYVFAFGAANNRLILGNPDLFRNLDPHSMQIRVPQGSALSRLFSGLTHMNGARHTLQRRLMTPAFTKPMLESYFVDIAAETERAIGLWNVGECRDIAREMDALTLNIATRVLLGLDPANAGHETRRLLRRWTDLIFSLPAMLLPFDIPGLPFARLLARSSQLEQEILTLIAHRRERGDAKPCTLSALLQAHDDDHTKLTTDELIGQTAFLFVASQSTTTNALTWTLLLLERHPQIWDAVRAEVAQLDCPVPRLEQLQKLTLLDAVVRESLRLLPPVTLWCKVATAQFAIDGYRLPAGTKVIQSALITQRDEVIYPQPDRFIPARWHGSHFDAYQFCAFSAGPRMCLGSALALLEIKLVVAMILRRFRLNLPAGNRVDVRGPMILAPKRGLKMTLGEPEARPVRNPLRGALRELVELPD